MSYLLTKADRAAERFSSQAEDARERLANIRELKNTALWSAQAILEKLCDDAEKDGKGIRIPTADRRKALAAIKDNLDDVIFDIVRDLEDMEIGEGRWDGEDDGADRLRDQRRDDAMEGRS